VFLIDRYEGLRKPEKKISAAESKGSSHMSVCLFQSHNISEAPLGCIRKSRFNDGSES
jgi:hypothetical protein